LEELTLSNGSEEEYKILCREIPELFFAENYAQIKEDPNLNFIVFKKDETLVGGSVYLVTTHRPNPENFPVNRIVLFPAVYGETFGIVPEYRGRGFGTQALQLREEWVKEKHDAVLLALKAIDRKAMKWFMDRGYKDVGDSLGPTSLVKYFGDRYEQKLRKEGLI